MRGILKKTAKSHIPSNPMGRVQKDNALPKVAPTKTGCYFTTFKPALA
jgi:hypothetical protein